MCRSVNIFLVLSVLVSTLAFAQDNKKPADRLKTLRTQIEREEGRLSALNTRKKELVSELQKIESDRSEAQERKKKLSKLRAGIERELSERTAAVQAAQIEAEALRQTLQKRLVAIYKMHRRTSFLDYLFRADSTTDLLKRAHYMTSIAKHDRSYLKQLADVISRLESDRKRLDLLQVEKKEGIAEAEKLGIELRSQQSAIATLLREEREKARLVEDSLSKMRESALELEAVIANLTGKEEPGEKSLSSEKRFVGKGLRETQILRFPVEGSLLQKYGKHKHDEFADILFVKGLEVQSPEGALVRAIAPGKVIYDGELPGYHRVLILDHGKRYYSLYGRISSATRKLGELVDKQDVIAVVGRQDEKGRNFYFELRRRGKAINPSGYFESLPEQLARADASQ